MSLIWRAHSSILTSTEKFILLRMAAFTDYDEAPISISLTELANDTSFSRRSVINTIQSLLTKKLIIKLREHDSTSHTANTYRINVKLLESVNEPMSIKY
jgi:hypothetical protein